MKAKSNVKAVLPQIATEFERGNIVVTIDDVAVKKIVLITHVSHDKKSFGGVIIGGTEPLGYHSDHFISEFFKQFHGKVELEI